MNKRENCNILIVGDKKCGKTEFIRALVADSKEIRYKINWEYEETNTIVCTSVEYNNCTFNIWELSSAVGMKDMDGLRDIKDKLDYVLIGTKRKYWWYSLDYWNELLEDWGVSHIPTYELRLRSDKVGLDKKSILHVNVQRGLENEFTSVLNFLMLQSCVPK